MAWSVSRSGPFYPVSLSDELPDLTRRGSGSRVLEIGPGTGQATVPIARLGADVTAVELGESLAAVTARKLAAFSGVRVVVAAFEEWPLPAAPFDLVLAATAWHWLDPDVSGPKAATALRSGGHLAVISTHHIEGGTSEFFRSVQTCYERWDSRTEPGLALPAAASIPRFAAELPQSLLQTATRRYEWEVEYSANTYVDVLLTYSDHRALEPTAKSGLLQCIRDLIETKHGGTIWKRYLAELNIFRRR